MKDLQSKVYDFITDFSVKHGSVSRKKLLTSYVSLFLIFSILMVTTFAWFTASDRATISSDTFTMESGTNMRVNDGEELSNHIILDDVTLGEASSIDGRNIYFPTTGTLDSTTSNMVFREGTIGDQNVNYVYKNFNLRADSVQTDVYVKSYSIKVGDVDYNGSTEITFSSSGAPQDIVKKDECPIRIAFIQNSEDSPTVLEPDALIEEYVNNYEAVSSTDSNGKASVDVSTADPFSPYYMLGTPLFSIPANTPLDVTMVVWLEGGVNTDDGTSNCDKYAGLPISIDIEIESNFSNEETVYFIDDTHGDDIADVRHWITDAENPCKVTMTYIDTDADGNSQSKTIVMQEAGKINDCPAWKASIPTSIVTNITFARYSVLDETIYNAWYTSPNIATLSSYSDFNKAYGYKGSLQNTREDGNGNRYLYYTALGGNGRSTTTDPAYRLAPCVGYWGITFGTTGGGSSSGGGSASGGGTSGDTCKVTVIVQDDGNKVTYDMNNNNAKLYAKFSDGTEILLDGKDGDRPKGTGSVACGRMLTKIVLKHSSGYETTYSLSSAWTVPTQGSYTITCTIGSDGKVSHN